jgi:hypothetical protein
LSGSLIANLDFLANPNFLGRGFQTRDFEARFVGIHALARARALCVEGFFNPAAASLHFLAFLQIVTKSLFSLRAILKALQIGFEFEGRFGGKTIDHPGAVPRAFDEPVLSQVSEVLGNLGLRKFKDLLKMANAQRSVGEQVNDSQPCCITETLVNLDQIHAWIDGRCNIFVNNYI